MLKISLKVQGINPGAYFTPSNVYVLPEQVCPYATIVELTESTILLSIVFLIYDL